MENVRKEKEKIIKEKELKIGEVEQKRKKDLEIAESDKQFLRRELDQANEALVMYQKNAFVSSSQAHGENGIGRKKLADASFAVPSAKRPKIASRIPTNIDESLCDDEPGPKGEPRCVNVTNASVQTAPRRVRTSILHGGLIDQSHPLHGTNNAAENLPIFH